MGWSQPVGWNRPGWNALPVPPGDTDYPSVVARTQTAYGTRSNTAVAVPAGVPAGGAFVILLAKEGPSPGGGAIPSVTAPSGFTQPHGPSGEETDGGGTRGQLALFIKFPASGSESGNFTFTHSSMTTHARCIGVQDVAAVRAVFASGNGNTSLLTGFVTDSEKSLIVGGGMNWNASAQADPSGMIELDASASGILDTWTQEVDGDDEEWLSRTFANNNGNGAFVWCTVAVIFSATEPEPLWVLRDATNTGTTGVLTPSAPITTSSNGQIIENLEITGGAIGVNVQHDDVIVRNCKIVAGTYGVDGEDGLNVIVRNCEIDGDGTSQGCIVLGTGGLAERCNLYGAQNGVLHAGDSTTTRQNFVHDLESSAGDPHYDGVQVSGGSNILIEENTIISRDTSDVFVKDDFGTVDGVIIRKNWLEMVDGSFCLYLDGRGPGGGVLDATVEDNIFVRGGASGEASIDEVTGLTWARNVKDTGELVEV